MTILALFALLSSPVHAQTASVEQRLAGQIAGCALQVAQYGKQIDELKEQLAQAQKDLEEAKKEQPHK